MAMRPATALDIQRWDELVAANPDGGMALQTKAWGDFKGRWGWKPHRFVYELADGRRVAAQWLERRIGAGQRIWYCPKGPGVITPADYAEVVSQTRDHLPGVFARFESEVLADNAKASDLIGLGLVKGTREPGSKSTIFMNLSLGEAALLASFSQSARRNIRKAEAGGVVVSPMEATADNLDTMFELMKATEKRAHYGLRPKAYFLDYWRAQIEAGQGQLLFASAGREMLAGIFVTFVGKRAWYKDGGSFDKRRELNATYLMQWEVMRWLMARGITSYDLVGVPNRDQVGTGDSRDGLYEFKAKFNPEITEFIGTYDLPGSNFAYKLWLKGGERVAGKLANSRPERFLY
ncbi:peptidoglycan bridge formation glycyltransferase FemA/FemB family protein [Candidatus Saccharibacteria bacterium]|nr:peptidoglycan bridge formation glycyltransferase FemA/FemB family protein [Candidatus Saccharibacteria bacterium]